MAQQVHVILNPAADRGRAGARQDELREVLAEAGVDAALSLTRAPGHAIQLAREVARAGAKVVAAAGGDGTIHEVGQALVGTEAALGILPMGSGNDYIRGLGIPKDLPGAATALARGRRLEVRLAAARAAREHDEELSLAAAGLTNLIILQAAINLLVILDLLPNTGLPLPFISYGGSSLLFSLLAVGLIANISRQCTFVAEGKSGGKTRSGDPRAAASQSQERFGKRALRPRGF